MLIREMVCRNSIAILFGFFALGAGSSESSAMTVTPGGVQGTVTGPTVVQDIVQPTVGNPVGVPRQGVMEFDVSAIKGKIVNSAKLTFMITSSVPQPGAGSFKFRVYGYTADGTVTTGDAGSTGGSSATFMINSAVGSMAMLDVKSLLHVNLFGQLLDDHAGFLIVGEMVGTESGLFSFSDKSIGKQPTLELTVSPVPLPAALPFFVSGLGVLGLLGARRKRKTVAAARVSTATT